MVPELAASGDDSKSDSASIPHKTCERADNNAQTPAKNDNTRSNPMDTKNLHDKHMIGRTKVFRERERKLEELCTAKGVVYIPPVENEVPHKTQSRRRKLDELCVPRKKDSLAKNRE